MANTSKILKRRISSPNKNDPDSDLHEEMWCKKIKISNSPKHFGNKVLTRFSQIQDKSRQQISESSGNEKFEECCILQNGFISNEEFKVINIVNTCAFDSTAQIFMCLYLDIEYYNGFIRSSEKPFFKFVREMANSNETASIHKSRSRLLLKIYESSPALVSTNQNILLDATCPISFILEKVLPSPLTETRNCLNCDSVPALRPTFYIPLKDVFTFNQTSLTNLQSTIDFDRSCCSKCQGERPKHLFTNYGIAILDVKPTNNIYSIKISEISQTLSINHDVLQLKGIIHFEQMKLRNSNGHFRSYVKRLNNKWELHDDMLQFPINAVTKINPAILIYSKY